MTLAVWWYDRVVGGKLSFDVLVIGSGASGLAAAVSAERAGARVALATKASLQANNSSKAQGGIQASFGADDSPERRCVAAEHAGLLDPRDDARLRRRPAECRRGGVHRLARPARRRQPGDLRRGGERQGRRDPR